MLDIERHMLVSINAPYFDFGEIVIIWIRISLFTFQPPPVSIFCRSLFLLFQIKFKNLIGIFPSHLRIIRKGSIAIM